MYRPTKTLHYMTGQRMYINIGGLGFITLL